MVAQPSDRINALMDIPSSLAVAIAAEVSPFDPVRTRIEVCVAIVARGTATGVPHAVFPSHVPRRMCPRVRAAETIPIGMTGNTGRVIALCIVTVHAGFDVAPGELGVTAAATPDAERRETGPEVP